MNYSDKKSLPGGKTPDKTDITEISEILNSSLSCSSHYSATIANAFRSMRNGRGYTQAQMARMLEVSPPAYSHYERGERIPDVIILLKMSNLFCINISYLLLLSCIDSAKKNGYCLDEVFKAYGHGQILPQEEAEILERCSKLSPENRQNLKVFLESALTTS